jgi:hypothetical protein
MTSRSKGSLVRWSREARGGRGGERVPLGGRAPPGGRAPLGGRVAF